jgi:hypothetical protein
MDQPLRTEIARACRRLLSEQNRDRQTPTFGCFDRRFWSWKLVDFPEATFQRNVFSLAWQMHSLPEGDAMRPVLADAVTAGLLYATRIQHGDGSFDQAFPNERSFGATAFVAESLAAAYVLARDGMMADDRAAVEAMLKQAAAFLCDHDETHGVICNHLAGAAWALVQCADLFADERFEKRAAGLLRQVLANQSGEGWFTEYQGADPGYQTLCLYFLAQVAQRRASDDLRAALSRGVEFVSWFAHPDGSFGGEYGSRRTAICYPGGLALLARDNPLAAAMTRFAAASMGEGRAVGLADIDIANMAPLLSNCVHLADALDALPASNLPALPCQRVDVAKDFPQAGLYVRSAGRLYAVIGASNGGVLKVFDRAARRIVSDDGGYAGRDASGALVTTQVTVASPRVQASEREITIDADFCTVGQAVPTPAKFLLLRLLNLTAMASIGIGNAVKGLLVRLLIAGGKPAGLGLTRRIAFAGDSITVDDRIEGSGVVLRSLECGHPFVAIHMASSRYYPGFAASAMPGRSIDVVALAANGTVTSRAEIVP